MNTRGWLFTAAVMLCVSLQPAAGRAQSVPAGFVHELVLGGPWSGEPVALTFLPDGRPVVLERNGGGVRLAAVGDSSATLIHTIPNVTFELERGLLGVVPDPGWPTRPYLYFYYTRSDMQSVIERYKASGDLANPNSVALSLGQPYEVLGIPDEQAFHNGGTLRFGPDGMLYLSVGEDLTTCNAQDLRDLRGSILRMDVSALPDSGGGPPPKSDITPLDNPFASDPDENTRLIYVWGLRNPYRFSIDSATGDLWIGDVGFVTWEEVNHIPHASGGGQNCGWPNLEGPDPPGLGTCGQDSVFAAPTYYYPHGSATAAIIGGPLYRSGAASDNALPPSYDGSYFFMDWGGMWMGRLVEGSGGWELAPPVPGQPDPERWATDLDQISDIEVGPDGALWLAQKGGAVRGIYRIRRTLPTGAAAPTAAPPRAGVVVRPNPAHPGEAVEFEWAAPRAGTASLRIFDASGRLVRALTTSQAMRAGVVRWDGRDGDSPAAAGVYFYEVRTTGRPATGRFVMLR